jgi:hypothetical protein
MKLNATQHGLLNLEVLDLISAHIGHDHAIKRGILLTTLQARGWDISDRQMRLALEEVRNNIDDGAWICSCMDGDGYYRAGNLAELREYLTSEHNRGLKILSKVSTQARRASPILAGQFSMTGGVA